MVSNTNATRPSAMMMMVSHWTNLPAFMLEEMVRPSRMVMRLARVVCAVWDRLSSLRHSRSRLPNISIPTRDTDAGATSPAMMVTMIGKRMRVLRIPPAGYRAYGSCVPSWW